MAKYEQSTFREVVDKETGEVLQYENSKTFTKKVTEDNFYMTFIDYIAPFYKLPPNAMKLLSWMCKNAEFNTGTISITPADRAIIVEETGISSTTISSNLSTLKTNKLIDGGKGKFIINPQIFWKGELKARKELLKDSNLKVTFSIE